MKQANTNFKNLFIAFFAFIVLMGCSFNANTVATAANIGNSAQVLYTTIETSQCTLKISGIKATCEASIKSKQSTTLKIKMELQKEKSSGYETVKTWTSSKTGTALAMTETRNINILYDYRLKVTFTAGSETITEYRY